MAPHVRVRHLHHNLGGCVVVLDIALHSDTQPPPGVRVLHRRSKPQPQLGVAGEPQPMAEPGHGGVRDPGPLGDLRDAQLRHPGWILQHHVPDRPLLHRQRGQQSAQPNQDASGGVVWGNAFFIHVEVPNI